MTHIAQVYLLQNAAKLNQLTMHVRDEKFSRLPAPFRAEFCSAAEIGCMARLPQKNSAQRHRLDGFQSLKAKSSFRKTEQKRLPPFPNVPQSGGNSLAGFSDKKVSQKPALPGQILRSLRNFWSGCRWAV